MGGRREVKNEKKKKKKTYGTYDVKEIFSDTPLLSSCLPYYWHTAYGEKGGKVCKRALLPFRWEVGRAGGPIFLLLCRLGSWRRRKRVPLCLDSFSGKCISTPPFLPPFHPGPLFHPAVFCVLRHRLRLLPSPPQEPLLALEGEEAKRKEEVFFF